MRNNSCFFQMALYRISVVWFFVCYATSLAQECSRTDSLKDYRLVGHVISSDKENSIWSCFQTCKTKFDCRSLNYNLDTFICEINNRTKREKPDKFVPMEGSVYVDNPFRGQWETKIFNIIYDNFKANLKNTPQNL